MSGRHRRRTVLFSLACWMAAFHPAGAQSQPRPGVPDTLPPVQVTVLRTPFDIVTVPFSVAIVPPQDASLARPGFALDEVLSQLAGVQADNRLNLALGERIAIRGLGARSQFGVRGVRVIVDGIPATLADGQTTLNNVDLASLGHAEVLRGPASALYGNASGGVVLLASVPAPPTMFDPWLRLLRGSYDLQHLTLGGGGTHGRASYVLAGDRFDYGGFRAFSSARSTHLNNVLTYDAGPAQFKLVVNAEHHDALNPGGLSDSLLHIDRRQAAATNLAHRTGEVGGQTQVGTSTHVVLPRGELQLSGYALRRSLANPIPPSIIDLHRHAAGVRAAYAATLGTPGRLVTAMLGAESDLQHDDRQNYANVHGTRGAVTLDQRERVTSAAPFVQMKGELGRVNVAGGVRQDRFRFAAADRLITPDNPDDSGVRRMSALSPFLGISYVPARAVSLYANVATAFQTPTTTELANRPNGAGGFNPTLEPEHVHSAEAGVQGTVGPRAAYHADLYRMRITGELLPFEVPSAPGRQFYRNAAQAAHRGVEAEGSLALTPLISLHASYAHTLARIVADTAHGGTDVGRRVPGIAPDIFTAAIGAGAQDGRFVSVEVRAQSATPVNDANTVSSAGYAVANLRASVPTGAGVSLFGGVGNLFDARYNTSVVVNAAGGRYFEPAADRTVYLGCQWAPRRAR